MHEEDEETKQDASFSLFFCSVFGDSDESSKGSSVWFRMVAGRGREEEENERIPSLEAGWIVPKKDLF